MPAQILLACDCGKLIYVDQRLMQAKNSELCPGCLEAEDQPFIARLRAEGIPLQHAFEVVEMRRYM